MDVVRVGKSKYKLRAGVSCTLDELEIHLLDAFDRGNCLTVDLQPVVILIGGQAGDNQSFAGRGQCREDKQIAFSVQFKVVESCRPESRAVQAAVKLVQVTF